MKHLTAAFMLVGLTNLSGCTDETETFDTVICEHDSETGVSWILDMVPVAAGGDMFKLHPRGHGEAGLHETPDPYEGECTDTNCVGNKSLPQNRMSIVSIDRLTGKATFSINEDDAVSGWWHATCNRYERKF